MKWPEAEEIDRRLAIYPAGRLVGTLKSGEVPDGFCVRFESVEPVENKPSSGRALCPPEEIKGPDEKKRFACEIPLGSHDLRFWAQGFADAYVWGVESRTDAAHDVGELTLIPGASLVGWVEAETEVPLQNVELKLQPVTSGRSRSPEASRRQGRKVREARPDDRGFFQIVGLEPGVYKVQASHQGFAPAHASVRLWPNRATRLERPFLVLRRPAELEVFLHPPLPPTADATWRVRLDRVDRSGRPLEAIGERPADLGGNVRYPEVPFGRTRVTVLGPEQMLWHTEVVEVELPREELFVDLQLTEIRGSIHRGEEPIQGVLRFGRGFTGRLTLESDEHGAFKGYVPGPGPWQIAVESEDSRVKKTLNRVEAESVPGYSWKRVDVQILETALRGRVVDAEGAPFMFAQVSAVAMVEEVEAREAVVVQRTDELGEFEMLGLAAGRTVVSAVGISEGRRFASREPLDVEIEVGETDTDSIELVLHPSKRFEGRVTHGGRPVSGAQVLAIAAENVTTQTPRMITDENGIFSLELPDSTRRVLLALEAPGFAYTLLQTEAAEARIDAEMSRDSGTLALYMPPELFAFGGEIAALFHDGGFLPVLTLQSWALRQGSDPWAAPNAEIPQMAPGAYRLCRISRLQMQTAVLGAVDPAACAEGFLAPGGRLSLRLKTEG